MATAETPEEHRKRIQREAELQQERSLFISHSLSEEAKKKPGIEQRLYYARVGQYGKGEEVLCTAGDEQYYWVDPTRKTPMQGLRMVIATSVASMVAMAVLAAKDKSYCVFERRYKPTWSITEDEVMTIYQKESKRGR